MTLLFCMNTCGYHYMMELSSVFCKKQNDSFLSSLALCFLKLFSVYRVFWLRYRILLGCLYCPVYLIPQFRVIPLLYGLGNMFNPISEAEVWAVGWLAGGAVMAVACQLSFLQLMSAVGNKLCPQ